MTQEVLIWSLAHTSCGALGEPAAKPAWGGRFLFLSACPKTQKKDVVFSLSLGRGCYEVVVRKVQLALGNRKQITAFSLSRICGNSTDHLNSDQHP